MIAVAFRQETIVDILRNRCPVDQDDPGYTMWMNIVYDFANLMDRKPDRDVFVAECDQHGVLDL